MMYHINIFSSLFFTTNSFFLIDSRYVENDVASCCTNRNLFSQPWSLPSLDRFRILEGKPVPFHPLEGLGTTDQGFDVFGIHFQDGRTIRNDTIKVRNLFVTGGTIRVGLQG